MQARDLECKAGNADRKELTIREKGRLHFAADRVAHVGIFV